MRIATVEDETTLSELAARIFKVEGAEGKTKLGRAAAAIRRQNPHLKKTLRPGDVVIIPEVEGMKASRGEHPVELAAGELLTAIAEAVGSIGQVLDAAVREETAAIRKGLEELNSAEFRRLQRATPELKAEAKKATAAHKARLEGMDKMKAAQRQTAAKIEADFRDLLKQLTRREWDLRSGS